MSVERNSSLARRAAVHAALADPARLAITDTLLAGDASPSELAGMLAMPSNLLAHHLHVLEQAGVITRRRSEGDRRRTYLRLIPGALDSLAAPPARAARRVLFVCTANSARSHLAAALWRRASTIPAASAGTHWHPIGRCSSFLPSPLPRRTARPPSQFGGYLTRRRRKRARPLKRAKTRCKQGGAGRSTSSSQSSSRFWLRVRSRHRESSEASGLTLAAREVS